MILIFLNLTYIHYPFVVVDGYAGCCFIQKESYELRIAFKIYRNLYVQ